MTTKIMTTKEKQDFGAVHEYIQSLVECNTINYEDAVELVRDSAWVDFNKLYEDEKIAKQIKGFFEESVAHIVQFKLVKNYFPDANEEKISELIKSNYYNSH